MAGRLSFGADFQVKGATSFVQAIEAANKAVQKNTQLAAQNTAANEKNTSSKSKKAKASASVVSATKAEIAADRQAQAAISNTTIQLKRCTSAKYLETDAIRALINAEKQEQMTRVLGNFKLTTTKNKNGQVTASIKELTAAQKLSMGMWTTMFPRLDKTNKIFNSLRWSMVNFTFALAGIAMVVSPFVLLLKQGLEWEQQLKRIQVIAGNALGG